MPTVKIEILKGRELDSLMKMKKLVLESVVETLKLPAKDQNIRILEYETGFFEMKPPYEILIEISMFIGRSKDTKRNLFRSIVNKLETNGIIEKEKVLIILHEQPLENWGVRGGFPADEIELGFKVNV